MASPDNILLHLPESEEQQVRQVFGRLEERGFPAQRQRPHITITFAPTIAPEVVQFRGRERGDIVPMGR